ncbi:hypothetical protein BH10PSE4_BH10PSE4_22780 [soil metagenome]
MDAVKVRRHATPVSKLCTPLMCVLALLLVGCGAEKRHLGAAVPLTPPILADDPRAAGLETNAFELSEGARQCRWAACGQCHGSQAQGAARLDDDAWRCGGTTTQIYRSIAQGCGAAMPAYAAKATPDQIWRMAAYVHSLSRTDAKKRRRADNALAGEPQGSTWKGPLT